MRTFKGLLQLTKKYKTKINFINRIVQNSITIRKKRSGEMFCI